MPSSNSTHDRDALEGLEAYLDSLEGDPDKALVKLAGREDAESVRRRLAILIDNERYEDAARETLERVKDGAWADLGIFSLAANGEKAKAEEFLEWAKLSAPAPKWLRGVITYYDGTMCWVRRYRKDSEIPRPGTLSTLERTQIEALRSAIGVVASSYFVRGRIDAELEVQILLRYLESAYLLEEFELSRKIVDLLITRKPIPLRVANAIIQELVPPDESLLERIWSEHPKSFQARFLVCVIRGRKLHKPTAALESAYKLIEVASSRDEKEDLSQLISDLTDFDDPAAVERMLGTAAQLLGKDAAQLTLIKADILLHGGDAAAAFSTIECSNLASHPQGVRIKGTALLKLGKPVEALQLFQDFSKTVAEPGVFKLIAEIARNNGRESDEEIALEQLIAIVPGDMASRRRLANLLSKNGRYKVAAKHLQVLHAQHPGDTDVTVNLAVCYAFEGRQEQALEILEEPDVENVALPIFKTRAQILQALGRIDEAFQIYEKKRNEFWNSPEFLIGFLTLAHAAGKEALAHEVLTRLLELKGEGLVDDSLMRAGTEAEIRDLISGAEARMRKVRQLIIEGKMPWILSAELEREALLWAWTLRTQSAAYLVDDPIVRASHCIYSTNSFRAFATEEANMVFAEIECAPQNSEIVADISALITLHSLGMLDHAARYFSKILVPANYLPTIINDRQRLFPHQLSQKNAADEMKSLLDQKKIMVLSGDEKGPEMQFLDEYQAETARSGSRLLIQDLLDVLHEHGLITDEQRERANSVAHKPKQNGIEKKRLQIGANICIEDATLVTLCGIGLLDVVTKNFSVFLSQTDSRSILGRVRAFEALNLSQKKHVDLWNKIQSDERFEFVSATDPLAITASDDPERGVASSAAAMAIAKDLSLLADDRACQMILLNHRQSDVDAAFGTDKLLLALVDANQISLEAAADALLLLMEWRYRFVVLPPAILKTLSDRYRKHPPGSALRNTALYVHDCFRDEGLFGGLEATTPPVSVAVRLYQTWIQNIAEFIVLTWTDASINDGAAVATTNWAVSEFLPSPPVVLDGRFQAAIAALVPRTALSRALVGSVANPDQRRANLGLRALSDALGLSEREYLDMVSGVLNGI